jgi:hypothetical protein
MVPSVCLDAFTTTAAAVAAGLKPWTVLLEAERFVAQGFIPAKAKYRST